MIKSDYSNRCPICFEDYTIKKEQEPEEQKLLALHPEALAPGQKHYMHEECIKELIKTSTVYNNCITCKQPIQNKRVISWIKRIDYIVDNFERVIELRNEAESLWKKSSYLLKMMISTKVVEIFLDLPLKKWWWIAEAISIGIVFFYLNPSAKNKMRDADIIYNSPEFIRERNWYNLQFT